jgi:TRAP-type C4-dicarboxylate transport system permease small subunit
MSLSPSEARLAAPPPRPLARLRLADLPKLVLAALLVLAIGNLLVGVFLRYVVVEITDFFDWPTVSFFWVEEVGEFTLAWLTLIGAAVGVAQRAHFTLDLLVHRLPASARPAIFRFCHLLIAAFGLLAAYEGWQLCLTNSALASPGLEINLAWLYASALVGGALIAIYGLALAIRGRAAS